MTNKDAKLIKNLNRPRMIPARNGFGDGVVQEGRVNNKVVVLSGDLTESTRVEVFSKEFPERFFQMGIAEQNMMGVASGMALEGLHPFTASYAVFNPGRAWDQLRVSVCYNNVPVTVAGCHAGISVGPDGATHQALEDIASVRCLPNITVVVPCDYEETLKATVALAKINRPSYFRFGRSATPVFTTKDTPFKVGKALTLRDGKDLTIIGAGAILYDALMVAQDLAKEGIDIRVINCHTIKPIDKGAIIKAAKETKAFVTVEEHQIQGGVGSAICEVLAQNYPIPVEMVGMPNSFGESGEPAELLAKYGMDKRGILNAVVKILKRK